MKSVNSDSTSASVSNTNNELQDVTTMTTITATKKRQGGANNRGVDFYLDIDAGAKRVKCRLNGVFKSFNAEAKEIKGEVPLRNDGCFGYRKKNYVVGNAIDRVNGMMIVSSQDNKLTHLDIWILGALTHYRKQLKAVVENRRRKNLPAHINLYLQVVTLSTPRGSSILTSTLSQNTTGNFNYGTPIT